MEKELDSLAKSEVPESNEKKGELVMKLKKDLIFELNKLLFNNTSDSKGGEEVRKLFRTFQDDVFKVSRRVASYSLAGKGKMGRDTPIYSSPYINFELRIPSKGFRMPRHRLLIPSDGFLILSDGCWMPSDRFRNLRDGFRIPRHGSGSQAEEPNQYSHARTH